MTMENTLNSSVRLDLNIEGGAIYIMWQDCHSEIEMKEYFMESVVGG